MNKKKTLLAKTSKEMKMMRQCAKLAAKAMLTTAKGERPHIGIEYGLGKNDGTFWYCLEVTFMTETRRLDIYDFTVFETFCKVAVSYGDENEEYKGSDNALQLLDEFLTAHNYGQQNL